MFSSSADVMKENAESDESTTREREKEKRN